MAVLMTQTALLSTLYLGHLSTVWERHLPPYPHPNLTPGQTAFINHHIAINKPLFLVTALAWLLMLSAGVVNRLRRPTIRSVLVALATLTAWLSAIVLVYGSAVEATSSQSYPYPGLTSEQAAYQRYHREMIVGTIMAASIGWLLTAGTLIVWLLSLAVRRRGGPARRLDVTKSDGNATTGMPSLDRTAGPPGTDAPSDRATGEPSAATGTPGLQARRGRFVNGFAALHWLLSLLWLFLSEKGLLSGLSRLRNLDDEAFMRQYANPHLYARSQAILATAELVSGMILLVMTFAGFILVFALRRGRAWSRWLALAQSGLLLLAGGSLSIPLVFAKSWKLGDACQWMLPGLFLGLFSLLLWSPRLAVDFRPRQPAAEGASRPG